MGRNATRFSKMQGPPLDKVPPVARWLNLQLPRDLRRLLLDDVMNCVYAPFCAAHSFTVAFLNTSFTQCCAQHGLLGLLKWARSQEAPWNWATCAWAAQNGHLEVLKWAHVNGAPWDEDICSYAALKGHLELLQWARANGAHWDWRTCARAALNGHLEVLQWARAHGAPWNKWTCHWATRNAHLEVLQWARANGAPWNISIRNAAAKLGYVDQRPLREGAFPPQAPLAQGF